MKPILNVWQVGKQVLMAASESRMQPRKEHGAMQQVGTGEALAEQTGGCLERSPILTGGVNRGRGTRFQLLPQARLSSTSACPTPPALSSAVRLQSLKRPVLGGGSSRGPVDAPRSHVWGQKPRMHLTPQQRKIFHGFGTDVSWVGPGVERMEEAHQICKSMSIDMRQLKKWICNHRPRRFRRPAPELGVPLPCVILPPTAKSEVYGGAAHGNAGLKQSVSKGAELHQGEGQWGTRPAGGAAEDGGGGKQGPVDMAHFATAGNLRQIMGRKMKDFDPRKVQRLVEICKSYRQRQRIEAPHEPANGPPKKKRLMSLPADDDQLPWPPSLDSKVASPQNKHHFQGGGTLLADFTPFSGRSDPLAADSNGSDRGESAADTTGLRIEGRAKTETGLEQPALTYVHSSMRGDSAQPFDHTFLEGQFGNETRLLAPPPSPEPFLSWSGVADSDSQLRTEAGAYVGLGSGTSCNPPSHPAALDMQPPLEMGPLGDVARTSGTDGRENDGLAQWGGGLVSQQPMRGSCLFEKVLTVSDTSPLRRIILPKNEAELHLPKLPHKEGGLITVEDADRNRWQLRYRFWPNHRSRIYVFEDTAGFVHSRGLRPGDHLVVCRAEEGHLILNDRRRSSTPERDPSYCCAESEGSPLPLTSGSSFA